MGALIDYRLFQILLKALHIEVVDDLGKHTEGVGLAHLIIVLADVFGQLGYHYEDLCLTRFQFLYSHYYDNDIFTLMKTYISRRRLIVATLFTWNSLVTLKKTVLFSASGNSSP